jgi:hypothetical protein
MDTTCQKRANLYTWLVEWIRSVVQLRSTGSMRLTKIALATCLLIGQVGKRTSMDVKNYTFLLSRAYLG